MNSSDESTVAPLDLEADQLRAASVFPPPELKQCIVRDTERKTLQPSRSALAPSRHLVDSSNFTKPTNDLTPGSSNSAPVPVPIASLATDKAKGLSNALKSKKSLACSIAAPTSYLDDSTERAKAEKHGLNCDQNSKKTPVPVVNGKQRKQFFRVSSFHRKFGLSSNGKNVKQPPLRSSPDVTSESVKLSKADSGTINKEPKRRSTNCEPPKGGHVRSEQEKKTKARNQPNSSLLVQRRRQGQAVGNNQKSKAGFDRPLQKQRVKRRNSQISSSRKKGLRSSQVPEVAVNFQGQALPSMREFLDTTRAPNVRPKEPWTLDWLHRIPSNSPSLPPLKEILHMTESLPFDSLDAAARDRRHRKPPPNQVQTTAQVGNDGLPTNRNPHRSNPRPTRAPMSMDTLQSQNREFAREILTLRGELVLAYRDHAVPPARDYKNNALHSRDYATVNISKTVSNVHTAITLTHLASQASAMGFAEIPKDVFLNNSSTVPSNPYLACSKDALQFIRSQMANSIDERTVRVISTVFRDVHVKILQDVYREHGPDNGFGNPVASELVSFLFSAVNAIYDSLLQQQGGIDIRWCKTVSSTIVQVLAETLSALSKAWDEDLKKLLTSILQRVAKILRQGESDPLIPSVKGLCHALEVSMAIALTSPDSALLLPRSDLYTIGRHSNMFATHVFFLDSSRRTQNDDTLQKS